MASSDGNDAASPLMSLPDVARYLGMKERTIYVWAQEGRIPAFKLGATWRFRREEINAWLETHRSGPDFSRGRRPIVPPVQPQPTRWQIRQQEHEARRSMLDECKSHIETTIGDEDQTVFLVDRFVGRFDEDVVRDVVRQLRMEKKIVESDLTGQDGEKVKVIRRRT